VLSVDGVGAFDRPQPAGSSFYKEEVPLLGSGKHNPIKVHAEMFPSQILLSKNSLHRSVIRSCNILMAVIGNPFWICHPLGLLLDIFHPLLLDGAQQRECL